MKKMGNLILLMAFFLTGLIVASPQLLHAHCQIPCGIYDDHARVLFMLEDAATVEKSTRLIAELSGKHDAQSQNQLVRWIMNKEKHAQNIISIISDYFLTQRVNPTQKGYSERLAKHHAVIMAAMKAKQNADLKHAKILKKSIESLLPYYPENKP
jgi:nickel superoxide dismutase